MKDMSTDDICNYILDGILPALTAKQVETLTRAYGNKYSNNRAANDIGTDITCAVYNRLYSYNETIKREY
jgi:hypothetical protein